MIFFWASNGWQIDCAGLHNLPWVEADADGLFLRVIGRRVAVRIVCPD